MLRFLIMVLAACGSVEPVPTHRADATPCFPDRRALNAYQVYDDLRAYIPSLHETSEPIPPTSYGTCTLADGELREATGRVVGDLHCGFEVWVPGIFDDRSHQVGDLGRDVIASYQNARDRIHCVPADDLVSCWFMNSDDPDDWAMYVYLVAGKFEGEMLAGDAAVALFAPRRVAKLEMRGDCH